MVQVALVATGFPVIYSIGNSITHLLLYSQFKIATM